jgi:hypothetical protein
MEPPVLYSQTNAFEERNSFLYSVLGVISLSHCFIRDLQREEDDHLQLDRLQGKRESTETLMDDQFLCFTLGLISLSRYLLRNLEEELGEPAQVRGAQGAQEPREVSMVELDDLLL